MKPSSKLFPIYVCFIAVFWLSFTNSLLAADGTLTLAWDANTESNLIGYRLYYKSQGVDAPYDGQGADQGNSPINIPATANPGITLSGLDPTLDYEFAVTAYNSVGESEFSAPARILTVNSQANVNGHVDPEGTVWVEDGGSHTITITPDAGYVVSDVRVNGGSVGAVPFYTIDPVTANQSLSATFAASTMDSDNDGLTDYEEVTLHGTDPLNSDSDSDGYSDGFEVSVGTDPGNNMDHPAYPPFESGEAIADNEWQLITFNQNYINPVVVAGPLSSNGADPSVVRIRNITSTGFEIRVQEYNYLNGTHCAETIGYMVMEAGDFTLGDGTRVSAGRFATSVCNDFAPVSFGQSFNKIPVVLTSVDTYNGTAAVVSRVMSVDQDGFEHGLQEEQAGDQTHLEEMVHYIAWEPFVGELAGHFLEVGRTEPLVTDELSTIDFTQPFSMPPVFVADMQTANGLDPAGLRCTASTKDQVQVWAAEEQSADSEVTHVAEAVGYWAMQEIDYHQDSDGDMLTDYNEVTVQGTDPNCDDTDGDGLNDYEEVTAYGTDPLNSDSDSDGYSDGFEVSVGTDPGNNMDHPAYPPFESGEAIADNEWQLITFNQNYINPVVVAGPLSSNGADPSVVRIRNITSTGFEIRVQEYNYLNGTHCAETIGYMVMEAGDFTLGDGTRVSAGRFATSVCNDFAPVSFGQSFNKIPVVLTSVDTYNGTAAVVSRVMSVDQDGFEHGLQEEQAGDQTHLEEMVHYIAWEPFVGELAGHFIEVGRTPPVVTDELSTIDFVQPFTIPPVFVADLQTANGLDPVGLRCTSSTSDRVQVWAAEEQSADSEVTHVAEDVGYIAVE